MDQGTSSSGRGGLVFPLASQAQLVRAAEKDNFYAQTLEEQFSELANMLLGARNSSLLSEETRALARLCYHICARGQSDRTPGEEDCDLLPMVLSTGTHPYSRNLGVLVLLRVGLPYAAARSKRPLAAGQLARGAGHVVSRAARVASQWLGSVPVSWSRVGAAIEAAERWNLVLFLCFGKFYLLANRLAGVSHYRFDSMQIEGSGHQQAHYLVLGLLMLLQVASSSVAERRASGRDGEEAEVVAGMQGVSQAIKFTDMDGAPIATKEDGIVSDASGATSAMKCPLCLSGLLFPTSTACGHVFCWDCILQWCIRKAECPLCRAHAPLEELACMYHASF